MPGLEVGKKAPSISGPAYFSQTKETGTFKLSDFSGEKNIVLYFYPKDDTPGCTKEAIAFSKGIKKLEKLDAIVVGVSPDTVEKHQKFAEKYDLKVVLVSDESKKICEKYGVWVEKSMYGRQYMGVQRATFLIAKDGKIAKTWPKVKVDGHDQEVNEALQNL